MWQSSSKKVKFALDFLLVIVTLIPGAEIQQYKKDFIEFAAKAGALQFGERTLKDGRHSPYFFNAGEFKTGGQLSKLGEFYARCYKENFNLDNVVLFGPAYKGIPLVTVTAVKLFDLFGIDLPLNYNRKEEKTHGEGGSIVGAEVNENTNSVVTDDVMTAGTALGEAKELLAANGGAKIAGAIVLVDRMERRTEDAKETTLQEIARTQNIKIYSIVTIAEILEHLYNREVEGKIYIGDAEKAKIEQHLNKYGVPKLTNVKPNLQNGLFVAP